MKKYIISTLTAAAAMAVPAFADATLLDSWDFSSLSGETPGSIVGSNGTLTMTTGTDSVNSSGSLVITPSATNKTTVNISDYGISLDEGISVVLTITGWSGGSSAIFASIETDGSGENHDYAAAIGQTGQSTSTRSGYFLADGGSGNFDSTTQVNDYVITYPTTVIMTFVGDELTLYQYNGTDLTLVATATMTSGAYSDINGTIKEVALGSWDSTSVSGEFTNLQVSSVEIWRGDVTTLPEPSMFGLMFGLGAIGLVATRRRKRA